MGGGRGRRCRNGGEEKVGKGREGKRRNIIANAREKKAKRRTEAQDFSQRLASARSCYHG